MSNNAVRNIVKTRFYQDKEKYSIIIPAAGAGTRFKNQEPKCLIKLNSKETIISRQLRIINQIFPTNEIILVVGYNSDYIMNNTPNDLIKIENEKWEENNVARSISMGLRAATTERVVIMMGDLVFNTEMLNGRFNNESVLVGHSSELMKAEEVGMAFDKNHIVDNLMIEMPNKWAQVAYFTGNELNQLKQNVWKKENSNLFTFEIINNIIDNGGRFLARFNDLAKCVDVDTNKDLEVARTIC